MPAATTKVEPRHSSVFAVPTVNVNTRTVQSGYLQTDTSYLTARNAGDVPGDASQTIVLQYGSRHFKVGFARDALPRTSPQVIAHRNATFDPLVWPEETHVVPEEELSDRLAGRYRNAKKKPPPNIYTSLIAHNRAVVPQTIPALNDSYTFDWTRTGAAPFVCGKEALRINPAEPYRRRWPIYRGNFNRRCYRSYRQVLDDLEQIWASAIVRDLKLPRRDFSQYGIVLVVPDRVRTYEIRGLTELCLRQLRFKSVAFLLESVAGTFGSGVSAACVLDIGAQTSRVCCVEDGQIVKGSQSLLPYGGDQLTQLFLALLQQHSFPYQECNLARALDFELMDELKLRLCTMDEDDLASAIFEAYVRRPGHPTKVYPFKVFEERIIVPMAMFEEGVPLLRHLALSASEDAETATFYTGEADGMQLYYASDKPSSSTGGGSSSGNMVGNAAVPAEDSMDGAPPPDDASLVATEPLMGAPDGSVADIVTQAEAATPPTGQGEVWLSVPEAIFRALDSLDSPDRIKKCLASVLIIGNGHKFPRLVAHLEALLRERYPDCDIEFVLGGGAGSVATGKENLVLDAGIVAWKGGAVFAKLDCCTDAWISQRDYENCGIRAFRERLNFVAAP